MMARRFAPAFALVLALSASGCAGFSVGCGGSLGSVDPMSDGASRLNQGYQRFQLRAQTSAMQQKAMMAGYQYRQGIRRPDQVRQPGQFGGMCQN